MPFLKGDKETLNSFPGDFLFWSFWWYKEVFTKFFSHNSTIPDILGYTINTFFCAISPRIFIMQTKVKLNNFFLYFTLDYIFLKCLRVQNIGEEVYFDKIWEHIVKTAEFHIIPILNQLECIIFTKFAFISKKPIFLWNIL